ncbi:MAG: hypothetical protein J6U96_03265 [Elusimicrobiaceae bacterium]|nr:hypothetical protein [Elusimicrobiaceae bacterium]
MKKLFLFLFFSFLINGAAAQSLEVTQQNIPQEASFAQPFDVRFALNYPAGYEVVLDKNSLPADFGLSQEKTEETTPGQITYDLTFLPFTLGKSTFTAVNFILQDAQGQTVSTAASKETTVQVKPVKLFKDKKMRDIRPPYIPSGWLFWLMILLALAALIYLIRRFWRKARARARQAALEQDNRPADVIALSKINILLQSGLWEKAQYKLFYIELGEILREYFWRRFQLDVSADTSAELLRRTRTVPELTPLYTDLKNYLNSSDLVKFAKYIPDEATMHKDVNVVRKTVQQTTPSPAPQTQEEN